MHWGLHLCCCQSHLPQPQALEREAQGSPEKTQLRLKWLHGKDPQTLSSLHSQTGDWGLGRGRNRDPLRQSQSSSPTLTVQPTVYCRHARPCALETVLSKTSVETHV